MALQRAVVKGRIAGLVETRSMFTAEVVSSGGDTDALLWNTYLGSIYTEIDALLSVVWNSYEVELAAYALGSWVPFQTFPQEWAGSVSGDYLPNAVAAVFLGKASGIRHVGRKFMSPIPESMATANGLTVAAMVIASAALLAYVTPVTGIGGGTLVPGVADSAGVFHPFVGGLISSVLGSMRKRKPGNGI